MYDSHDVAKDLVIRLFIYEHEKSKKRIEELEKAYADAKNELEEYRKKVEPE